ncbi:MAG TPA: aminoacyl-tRNA hydrolase [bacterium]|nr:aminoacyl-tRNA hydrolase [bacterium]HPN32822.1 aminoacyl-tRNA hydrolase [bacterium]
MKIIAGLGNPGNKYGLTRHNAGFMTMDSIVEKNKLQMKKSSRFECEYADFNQNGEKVLIAKPTTYMNNSGRCLRKLIDYYDAGIQDIVVVSDDVNLEFGSIRIREKGSAGGHNGLKSIIECLGADNFIRVRIGVGSPQGRMPMEYYVLSDFNQEQKKELRSIIEESAEAVLSILNGGLIPAMNRFNKKIKKT